MGSINSKDFQEMLEDDISSLSPSRYVEKDELHDPRSPSSGIIRTPVQVLSVAMPKELEDPRSPTIGIDRTPICTLQKKPYQNSEENEKLIKQVSFQLDDPRSPTQGIDRTPINMESTKSRVVVEQSAESVILCDPRSPTEGIIRTPINTTKENSLDCSPALFQVPAIDDRDELTEPMDVSSFDNTLDAMTNSLHKENIQEPLTVKNSKEIEVPNDSVSKSKRSKLRPLPSRIHIPIDDEDNSSPRSKVKSRAVNSRSPIKALGDRSPLTSRNVDYNSPRAIVQRKQLGKVAMKIKPFTLKNSPNYKSMEEEDKENL